MQSFNDLYLQEKIIYRSHIYLYIDYIYGILSEIAARYIYNSIVREHNLSTEDINICCIFTVVHSVTIIFCLLFFTIIEFKLYRYFYRLSNIISSDFSEQDLKKLNFINKLQKKSVKIYILVLMALIAILITTFIDLFIIAFPDNIIGTLALKSVWINLYVMDFFPIIIPFLHTALFILQCLKIRHLNKIKQNFNIPEN